MPQINPETGGYRRPRKARALAERRKVEAQAFRILLELVVASPKWVERHPKGSAERDVTEAVVLYGSIVVADALRLAEANPDGSEGEQQKQLWLDLVSFLKGLRAGIIERLQA